MNAFATVIWKMATKNVLKGYHLPLSSINHLCAHAHFLLACKCSFIHFERLVFSVISNFVDCIFFRWDYINCLPCAAIWFTHVMRYFTHRTKCSSCKKKNPSYQWKTPTLWFACWLSIVRSSGIAKEVTEKKLPRRRH